MSPNALVRSV